MNLPPQLRQHCCALPAFTFDYESGGISHSVWDDPPRVVRIDCVLGGAPKFLRLPSYLRHKLPKKRRSPLRKYARIKGAMYGFKRAGADFSDKVRRLVVKAGWKRCRDAVLGVYYRGNIIMIGVAVVRSIRFQDRGWRGRSPHYDEAR